MPSQGEPTSRLGPLIRILTALIDAMIADDFQEWRVLGAVMTAMNRETPGRHGINEDRHKKAMRQWGATDRDPDKRLEQICNAAGLSERLRRVALLHFDRGLRSFEIAKLLVGPDAPAGQLGRMEETVRQQLHRVREKFSALAARTEL